MRTIRRDVKPGERLGAEGRILGRSIPKSRRRSGAIRGAGSDIPCDSVVVFDDDRVQTGRGRLNSPYFVSFIHFLCV